MTEDIIIPIIKEFLKQEKDKDNFIIPYNQEELCKNKDKNFKYHIYNEFSLQHELGIYLKNELNTNHTDTEKYDVFFEKNTKTFLENSIQNDCKDKESKYEVDIIIIKKEKDNKSEKYNITEKYAIELKFPIQGEYPNQMKKFKQDINFMKDLYVAWQKENENKKEKFTFNTYCLTLVNDHNFYKKSNRSSKINEILYKEFREINNTKLKDEPIKAEIKIKEFNLQIEWNLLKDDIRYYIVNIAELSKNNTIINNS